MERAWKSDFTRKETISQCSYLSRSKRAVPYSVTFSIDIHHQVIRAEQHFVLISNTGWSDESLQMVVLQKVANSELTTPANDDLLTFKTSSLKEIYFCKKPNGDTNGTKIWKNDIVSQATLERTTVRQFLFKFYCISFIESFLKKMATVQLCQKDWRVRTCDQFRKPHNQKKKAPASLCSICILQASQK